MTSPAGNGKRAGAGRGARGGESQSDQGAQFKIRNPKSKIEDPSLTVGARKEGTAGGARGTVLILHGIMARKEWMMPVAKKIAEHGYRAVLVDFRGHGNSSGDWLTFGVVETVDLQQVLDALDRERLLEGRVGVYGASYGGGVAIQLAGADSRVAGVVAVAPFESLDRVVTSASREMLPFGAFLLDDATIAKGIARAAELAQFDPKLADARKAIERTKAHVLLMHGRDDTKIPYQQSEEMAAAAPDRTRLLVLEHLNHLTIMMDPSGAVMRETIDWLDRYVGQN